MTIWKDTIDWATLPLTNTTTSFDKDGEVYLTITDKSHIDDVYLYNIGSIDFRGYISTYVTRWHTKLKIKWHNGHPYVNVNNKRIYIPAIMEHLKAQMKQTA